MPRGLKFTTLSLAMLAIGGTPAVAQKRVAVARPSPAEVQPPVDSAVPRPAPVPVQRIAAARPPFRPASASSYLLSRFDDNVNRDTIGVTSIGMITGLAARLESGPARPWLVLEYDVAMHRYSATTRFNRVSQRMRSTLSGRLQRWWALDLVTEGSLKGSSEDRDVSDQLMLQPRSEFRLGSAQRIRLIASQRWRRYPTDSLQDANNRYVAAEFRHRFAEGAEFETEVRMEQNDARGARFDYRRSAYSTSYATPLGARARLEVALQYRVQEYANRRVRIDDQDFPRRDHRLQPAVALQVRLGIADLELSYEPEWRRSNDPAKSIDQHVLLFGMRHHW